MVAPIEDDLSKQLRQEALEVERNEPELSTLLRRTVLASSVTSFEDAVASTVCYRLLLHPCETQSKHGEKPIFCPNSLRGLIRDAIDSEMLEHGHTMKKAIREDALAVIRRDPATESLLEVVLYNKGYAALVCHRAAHRYWGKRKFTSLFLQSQTSAVFGLDLHPAAQVGVGVMLDHGTGVVMGETAVVGDGCTILHGVTLGGTGKASGDRHPKIGSNVLIGAGANILGNIKVGDGSKIGAGSVVLREIPPHATAVGIPAKIIGRATESRPGSDIDETLESVSLLHKSSSMLNLAANATPSSSTPSLASTTESDETSSDSDDIDNRCPFREYTRMAKSAPANSITIVTLRSLLCPEGCTPAEIGSTFFALDTRNVGYIYRECFREHAVPAIVENTRLDKDRAKSIVSSYLAAE